MQNRGMKKRCQRHGAGQLARHTAPREAVAIGRSGNSITVLFAGRYLRLGVRVLPAFANDIGGGRVERRRITERRRAGRAAAASSNRKHNARPKHPSPELHIERTCSNPTVFPVVGSSRTNSAAPASSFDKLRMRLFYRDEALLKVLTLSLSKGEGTRAALSEPGPRSFLTGSAPAPTAHRARRCR